MRRKAHLTDAAFDDLSEIWAYIGERNPGAADRLLDEIDALLRHLAELPQIGRRVAGEDASLRWMPKGRYVIFYREVEDGIDVMRVLHGRRDRRPITG